MKTRRRNVRRTRTFRRRFRRLRIARPRKLRQTYSFKQMVTLTPITLSQTSNETYFAFSFRAADMANISEFQSLFDQFRINAVRINFIPSYNVGFQSSATSGSLPIPYIYTVVDYDDANVPTSIPQLQQYQSLKTKMFSRPHHRYFKPKCNSAALITSSSTSFGFQSMRAPWIDVSNPGPSVLHYGLRGCIQFTETALLPGGFAPIRVTAIYYLQCKYVR